MLHTLFSSQANAYAQHRPLYPKELFEFIAHQCAEHKLAWDSGTGNGQAACFLAPYFHQIYATDVSLSQIEHAFIHPKVTYKVEAVEKCTLPDAGADAVVAATAVHWFDLPGYYRQVDRVLRKNGILAVWSYADCALSPEIDEVVKKYHQLVREYWHFKIQENFNRYASLSFPYTLIETPDFCMKKEFTLDGFLHYLFTWSATQTYIKKHHQNPLDTIKADMENAWKGAVKKEAVWKLFMKIGRKE